MVHSDYGATAIRGPGYGETARSGAHRPLSRLWKDVIRMNRLSRATDPSRQTNLEKVSRPTRVGLRTAAGVLVAPAFPVISLLWASALAPGQLHHPPLLCITPLPHHPR